MIEAYLTPFFLDYAIKLMLTLLHYNDLSIDLIIIILTVKMCEEV